MVADCLAKDKDVLKLNAAVCAYGGWVKIDQLTALTTPTLFLYGGADDGIPQPQTADAIKALIPQIKVAVDVHVYPGMPHGFIHRFNPKDPLAVDASSKALVKTNEWFAKYM